MDEEDSAEECSYDRGDEMAILTEQVSPSALAETEEREAIFDVFRRWGYLQSWLDPLGQYLPPEEFPVPTPTGSVADEARAFYSGTFGVEFMHIPSQEQRLWLQQQVEEPTRRANQPHVLSQLIRADIFEQVIQARYMGTKRFSLEGLTVLIPFLDEVLRVSYLAGVSKSILAMSHRGRLNVMTNVIGRPPSDIFAEFEDVDPRSVLGGGDVKYHIGATGEYHAEDGGAIALHLASNPSHLEAVDPIVLGRARARQQHLGVDGDQKVLPIMIHGDAAFAGQGIVAESLVLGSLPGYDVGGTVHVIVNNLLGFTALPQESNCSRYASDLAKRLPIPIFHVNAEDPDAVIRVAGIAARFRHQFRTDVLVDIIGYRRHGHSEVDDPTVTQPIRYALIKNRPFLYQLYAEQMRVDPSEEVKQIQDEFLADQKTASLAKKKPRLARIPSYWDPYRGGPFLPEYDVPTGLAPESIADLCQRMTRTPEGFHIHPKVQKLYEQRVKMGAGEIPFDYGAAELLAFASLLQAGTPVRLSGQDSQRGTFSQRHAVLVDIENEQRYFPLQHLAPDQARFEVYNSMLSEAAVLGFEYGYSRDSPEALVLWEAQFGDFANGAQIIIDQFIAAGEAKWNLLSGLVLLLPHGYEGQGPEHSSARVERYLQLAANENIQICQPSTASQYFHLLRRQAMRKWRKPLVIFTPKSMLRSADASSPLADFTAPQFRNVISDDSVKSPSRILVCTGKVGHTLRAERARRKDASVAIIFLEQLYPWPEEEMQAALDQHPHASEIVWVQEEPANMGAFTYVLPQLRRMAADRAVLSVKRSASASPATGSAKAHALEEKALIDLAFGA
jgi:2-oxoglutarate dehydrogenase E1 component